MSGKDRWYKPKVKASGAQRESEGVVVPPMGADEKASGGKGPPTLVTLVERTHARAWPARPDPAPPHGREPVDKVRYLQRRLGAAAKRSPGRRFHALLDRIYRRDVLEEAWKRVRANRGAAGVDRETLADVEAYGVERMLDEVQAQLRAGTYRPAPMRRQAIPKADGGVRGLGIPTRVNYFWTGNAATKFISVDRYVGDRLRHFLVKRQGRSLRPGQASVWTRDWFHAQGLYRLRGTIHYPEVRNHA
jgi:hypothetical protein